MLELKDFYLLPEFDVLLRQLINDHQGLVLVAGLDPQTPGFPDPGRAFLPSGRATIFRILVRQMMARVSPRRVVIVTHRREAVRLPRALQRQVTLQLVRSGESYAQRIALATQQRPQLLVVDSLSDVETVAATLRVAGRGIRVLSQIDTVLHGAAVLRDLQERGLADRDLQSLRWILSVQRFPTLCPQCKQPAAIDGESRRLLQQRYSGLDLASAQPVYQAPGCDRCEGSGRQGEVAVFDLFHATADGATGLAQQRSLLPLESYLWQLIARGQLPLDDLLNLETDRLRRTYHLLSGSEHSLAQANQALQKKLAELESANRVLQHRTQALISLQEMNQALITVGDLRDLAHRVCRHTVDLCGADRAVLYFLHDPTSARVLASHGWEPSRVPAEVPADVLPMPDAGQSPGNPQPFDGWPPGIEPRAPDVEGAYLYAGLRLPLLAQDQTVGLLVVHATRRKSFAPGDVALLHSFANQAALALQRAGLIEQLRNKVADLEAAQAGLAQKERLDRELELARQVQQSALPRTVPQIAGYQFSMRNEPARQVGGDFYDLVALDDDYFAVTIADVSDKGMAAALYMALSRSLLLCEARLSRTPYAVLCSVNQLLLEVGQPNMFVTVFYGLVERATGRMTYIRAGHDRPLLFRGDTVRELDGRGMALGLLPAASFKMAEEEVMLMPGDRLVLYTDGLTDGVSPQGELYDRARFTRLLQRHAALQPEALCTAIFADLAAYRGNGPQQDDMTMLVIDVEQGITLRTAAVGDKVAGNECAPASMDRC